MLLSFTSDETPAHPTSRWNCQLSEKTWCLSSDFCIQRSNWKEGEQLCVLMWMFCASDRVDAVPGRKETLWPNRGVLRRQTHDLLKKPFSIQMPSSKCFSENNEWMRFWHVFISRFLNFEEPTQAVWILLLQSIWRFTNWCVWRTTAEDAFPPHVSLFYTLIIFPSCTSQCYSLSTVENEVNTPALLIITSFTSDSSVLRYSMLHFYISLLLTRTNKHFILMLLQKEQGCQLSGLNWCIYSNAIKKFYLSRCYSCSCVFVFISFCTAEARSLVNFAT